MMHANNGRLDLVRDLVEQKADINMQDKYGQSALTYASFCGYIEIVEFLLKHGAKPDAQVRGMEWVIPRENQECCVFCLDVTLCLFYFSAFPHAT